MKKHKAIAIVVSFTGDQPRFLTVRDWRFKDWIFVTGGCRRREITNPIRCALRELEEETRGVVSLKNGEYTDFKFVVKESANVDLEYNCFVFFVDYNRAEQHDQVKRFYEEKAKMNLRKLHNQPIRKTHDENDYMSYDTLPEFNSRKRWRLIVDNVIKNPEFYRQIAELLEKNRGLCDSEIEDWVKENETLTVYELLTFKKELSESKIYPDVSCSTNWFRDED